MKSLFIIILCFLLTSCSEKQYRIFTLPEETPVSGIDYPNELFMNYPWSIDIINDKLLLFATKGDYFMRIVDANNGKEIKQLVYSVADLKNLYNLSIGEKMVKKYMFMMKQKCT